MMLHLIEETIPRIHWQCATATIRTMANTPVTTISGI